MGWFIYDFTRLQLPVVAVLCLAPVVAQISPAYAMPSISLPEAATHVGQTVSIEFTVQSQGQNGTFKELYSAPHWQDPDCVFVRLPEALTKQLKQLGIDDLSHHFRHHRIRATGVVQLLSFPNVQGTWPCILVEKLNDLTVLPPRYQRLEIAGFQLHIHPDLDDDLVWKQRVSGEIQRQLLAIVQVVRSDRLRLLRKVPIRVEFMRTNHAANYPIDDPLGWDAADPLVGSAVTVNNAVLFVTWSAEQPWELLHEFAHAYHHQFLGGPHNAEIAVAYKNAMEKKLYVSVDYVLGGKKVAYAMTNADEYFAELSEAWFGRNDFYPFVRSELQAHDPVGFRVMQQIWDTSSAKISR